MKNINNYIGFSPELRSYLGGINLPPIRGKWFYVDPYKTGERPENSFDDIEDAYDACVSGRGDGIIVYSGGIGTSSQTTSYLSNPLEWSKHGITVVGACAPTMYAQRARIANVEHTTGSITTLAFVQGSESTYDKITRTSGSFITNGFVAGDIIRVNTTGNGADATGLIISTVEALTLTLTTIGTLVTETAGNAGASVVNSYNPYMINVSGSNNAFYNIHVGNFSSDAAALGCLKVTGSRNYFGNCHFIGAGHATPAAVATAYDLEINGGQENTFEKCVFGTDSVLWGAASGAIRFDTDAWRNRFYNCEVLKYSTTAGQGAINLVDATACNGYQLFKNCTFMLWNENGVGASTAAVIGTKPNSGQLLFDSSTVTGWSAWGAAGLSGCVYVVNADATASAAGGISTTL